MDKRWAGETLRHVRVLAGLEAREVALSLGLGKSAISHWENGRSLPSIPQLHALAALYGMAPRTLLDLMSIDSHHVAEELREWYRSRPDNTVPAIRDNNAQETAKRAGASSSEHDSIGSSIPALVAAAALSRHHHQRLLASLSR